jgi:hypothetical protein
MTEGSWQTIATVTAGPTGAVEFTDEDPPQPNGFYRLRKPDSRPGTPPPPPDNPEF